MLQHIQRAEVTDVLRLVFLWTATVRRLDKRNKVSTSQTNELPSCYIHLSSFRRKALPEIQPQVLPCHLWKQARVFLTFQISQLTVHLCLLKHLCVYLWRRVSNLRQSPSVECTLTVWNIFACKATTYSHDAPFGKDRVTARRTNERLEFIII